MRALGDIAEGAGSDPAFDEELEDRVVDSAGYFRRPASRPPAAIRTGQR